MATKKLVSLFPMIVLIFFILTSQSVMTAIPKDIILPYKSPSYVSKNNPQSYSEELKIKSSEELKIKRIVVMPQNIIYKDIPYKTAVWESRYEEIIDIAGPSAEVIRNSPNYGYVTLSIPESEYNQTVDSLNETGYKVEDEPIARIMLDESVPAIGAPYDPGSGTLTGAGRTIAILDTGIDCNHPDIDDCNSDGWGKLFNWFDVIDSNHNPIDNHGHGTHVAGIAAGTGDDSDGKFEGVAPDASLVVIRVCDDNGDCPATNVVNGLDWLFNVNGAHIDVISLSFGRERPSLDVCTGQVGGPEGEWYDYLMDAINRGIVVVAAAGNSGVHPESIIFPACIDDVIAVGDAFKRNYDSLEDLSGGMAGVPEDVEFHVIVDISGGFNAHYEKEWIATYDHGTGFYQTFFYTEPTTIKVKAEGYSKSVDWWTIIPCAGFYDRWQPGEDRKATGPDDDGEFWEWERTMPTGGQGFYAVIEIGARPFYTGKNFLGCYWTGWIPEEDIIVSIYPTMSGLRNTPFFRSGRGPPPQGGIKPDVVAPGEYICAARASGTGESEDLICGDNEYITGSGTSAATPHVAGLVALIKQHKPTASYDEIIDSIKRGAVGTGLNDISRQGNGVIHVRKSIDYIDRPPEPEYGGGGGGNLRRPRFL